MPIANLNGLISKKPFVTNSSPNSNPNSNLNSSSSSNPSPGINEAEAVAERVHFLQSAYEMTLPANQPYIVRLDGVAFRNFTSGIIKPFDARLTRAMILTTRDLLVHCAARTAYCQSDEISLVFAGEPTTQSIVYAGRVQKIVSVMAAWAAARFNWHIGKMNWNEPEVEEKVKERMGTSNAVFDARVFSAPTDMMAAEGNSMGNESTECV